MTQEQKRIKIAEVCGWAIHDASAMFGRHVDAACSATIPDYFNDLNAMHEAEKMLTLDQREQYSAQLALLLPTAGWDAHSSQLFEALHATAAQRAEAFGRTLGLWT